MNCKSANLFLEIYSYERAVSSFLCAIPVESYAASLKVCSSTVNILGFDCDMTVCAKTLGFVNFDAASCEDRAVAVLNSESEDGAETVCSFHCAVLALHVDADVTELKAENHLNCFAGQAGNFVKLTVLDKRILNHPAATAGQDFVEGKVRIEILFADAAGRHEFYSAVRSTHSFDSCETACCFSREELENFQTTLESCFNVRRIAAAGGDRNALFNTVLDNFYVKTRGNDEFCACSYCTVNLLGCKNSACTDEHFRECL